MTTHCSVTDDIGGRLRRAREQRGLSLHDVASRTKLTLPVIRAIERNDFTALPGGMFRKAYVRTLAVEVGLNPGDIVADYCAWFEPPVEPLTIPNRDATGEDKWVKQLSPPPRPFLGTLAALATLGTAWFLLEGAGRPRLPDNHAASSAPRAVGMSPAAPSVAATDRSPHAATPAAIATQASDVPLRIELTATGPCWVAADTDDERSMYRLVERGERLVLEAHRSISLRLGDAGAMTLSINNGPRRSAGGDGEVIELMLTPDNVEALRDGAVETVSGN
jgi:cytoskeleton protein RodZ